MIDAPAAKLLLTVEEAAKALSIGRSLMYEHVLRGEIPSVRIGRCRRIALADLRAFVDSARTSGYGLGRESSDESEVIRNRG